MSETARTGAPADGVADLRAEIARILKCSVDDLDAEAGLNAHPAWDSMAHVEIMVFLSERYGVEVSDETIRKFATMAAIDGLAGGGAGGPADGGAFDARWESQVYGAGRQLNRYPFDVVVSFMLSRFGGAPDRAALKVLDIGSGAGNHLWFLAREGFSAAGIEGASSAVDFSRKRLEADGLTADLRLGDFAKMPWADDSFDIAIDRGSITNNRRAAIAGVLAETARVLKPGGYFLSQIFSDRHSAIANGQPLGDGAYDNFSHGYFADISMAFFASRADLSELYEPHFAFEKIEHVNQETEGADEPNYTFWNLVAVAR